MTGRESDIKKLSWGISGGWETPENLYSSQALDRGVKPLVEQLNSLGFRTTWSCQGGGGHQYPGCYISIKHRKKLTEEDLDLLKSVLDVPGIEYRIITDFHPSKKYYGYEIFFKEPLGNSSREGSKENWPEGEDYFNVFNK